MTWRQSEDMTREELVAELLDLRDAVERLAARVGPAGDDAGETLHRYLSELAALGAQYGVELVPDADLGGMRIAPLSPDQGGYMSVTVDAGAPMLSSYGEGAQSDKPTDDVYGDSYHPAARGRD